jgi:hypothetical protein
MKALVIIFVALFFLNTLVALADEARTPNADQTITFTDGSKAVSYFNCGDGDLCARISNPDGTSLSIYSEGAALCQPYDLHFVKADAEGKTLFEYSRAINHTEPGKIAGGCGHTVATQMVMNRGFVHLNVTETADGTLDLKFSAAK